MLSTLLPVNCIIGIAHYQYVIYEEKTFDWRSIHGVGQKDKVVQTSLSQRCGPGDDPVVHLWTEIAKSAIGWRVAQLFGPRG